MTPSKRSLIQLAQENMKKAAAARRRLRYHTSRTSRLLETAKHPTTLLASAPMSSGAKEILAGELRNFDRHPNARTWTTKEKLFYYGIYKSSPKTYRLMKKQLTVPSVKTVKDVMSMVKLEPGLSPFLLKVLKKKTENYDKKDKVCALLFDEIFINMGLYYNTKTDRVEGVEDFGEGGRTNREANHMMVFMLRGLNSNWKLPVAFHAVNGTCPSEVIAKLIPEIVREMKKIDIDVICSISDQGPTNRGAITSLRSNCPEGETDPVYMVDDMKIIHLFDTPHLFKSIRNNMLTSDIQLEPGKLARWAHIVEFFKLDEGLDKLSKLTYAHLCPLGRNKMRVKPAAEVFSMRTATTMNSFHVLSSGTKLIGCEPTIYLLKFLDELFDGSNGRSKRDTFKHDRPDVTAGPDPNSSASSHHDMWLKQINELKKWVFIRKSDNSHHRPPCIQGYIDNLHGLGRIWKILHEKYGFEKMILRHLNQDPLENYFGLIRQTCGSNTDPTVPQFFAGVKTCLVQQVAAGRDTNCTADEEADVLADLEVLIEEASNCNQVVPSEDPILIRGNRPENYTETAFNKLTRQGPSLTCGTMCSKLLSATKRCVQCTKDLSSSEQSSDFTAQDMLNSTLDKPSPAFTNFYLQSQQFIQQNWKGKGWQINLRKTFMELIKEEFSLEWITCVEHREIVKSSLLELVVIRIINLICLKFNSELKAKKAKPTRKVSQTLPKSAQISPDFGIESIDRQDWLLLTGLPGTLNLELQRIFT